VNAPVLPAWSPPGTMHAVLSKTPFRSTARLEGGIHAISQHLLWLPSRYHPIAQLCIARRRRFGAGPSVVAILLKLDGFTGSSTDEKHAGEIELVSFNWSESNKGKLDPHDALVVPRS
jgi:hypothetical protein